jgi:hypothetical protein
MINIGPFNSSYMHTRCIDTNRNTTTSRNFRIIINIKSDTAPVASGHNSSQMPIVIIYMPPSKVKTEWKDRIREDK